MKKRKIINDLKEKNKDGKITAYTLYTAVFLLGASAIALNYTQANGYMNQVTSKKQDLNKDQNSDSYKNIIDHKVLESARLIKVEDIETKEFKIHICNIDLQNEEKQDICYKDIFKGDIIATIPIDQNSITEGFNHKTDIGLYTEKTALPIIDGLSYEEEEIKKDIEKIEQKEKDNQKEAKKLITKKESL